MFKRYYKTSLNIDEFAKKFKASEENAFHDRNITHEGMVITEIVHYPKLGDKYYIVKYDSFKQDTNINVSRKLHWTDWLCWALTIFLTTISIISFSVIYKNPTANLIGGIVCLSLAILFVLGWFLANMWSWSQIDKILAKDLESIRINKKQQT